VDDDDISNDDDSDDDSADDSADDSDDDSDDDAISSFTRQIYSSACLRMLDLRFACM
jgi:hypothetical protein